MNSEENQIMRKLWPVNNMLIMVTRKPIDPSRLQHGMKPGGAVTPGNKIQHAGAMVDFTMVTELLQTLETN